MDGAAFDEAEHLWRIACNRALRRARPPGLARRRARARIGRERLGDILVDGERAWLICPARREGLPTR
jgi:hypothetical protein